MATLKRTGAVFDNSAFAGVMRLYCPDVDMHRVFLRNYPEHRLVDQYSLADFLTALCIYGRLLLDSRSYWNEKEISREGYKDAQLDDSTASWAEQLTRLLPRSVAEIIVCDSFGGHSSIGEDESCSKAFDIMSSPLKSEIALGPNEHIPNVYFAPDYVYRPTFERLNLENEGVLGESELAQAMFLHRGLFLQSRAHAIGCTYMPYHYRGKMLSKLPPMIWAEAPRDGNIAARLPLAQGQRPSENDYMKSLNEYYYSLLQAATWKTYENEIPFVGAAILAKAHGDPDEAINIAMQCREDGILRRRFERLETAIQNQDRPEFESLLRQFHSELAAAARHFGVVDKNPQLQAFYKLATCWAPKTIESLIDAAVLLLPERIRQWGYKTSSRIISPTPFQVLFTEHVSAIRGV